MSPQLKIDVGIVFLVRNGIQLQNVELEIAAGMRVGYLFQLSASFAKHTTAYTHDDTVLAVCANL